MLLVTVFQSENFALDFIPLYSIVYMGFYSFFWSSVLFLFPSFRSVDLNKDLKWCLSAFTIKVSCMWAWSMPIFTFSEGLCTKMFVKKLELHQYKPSNWRFLYFSRVDFLEIDTFYSIYELICKKAIYFRFFVKFECFLATFFPLSFRDSSLSIPPFFLVKCC